MKSSSSPYMTALQARNETRARRRYPLRDPQTGDAVAWKMLLLFKGCLQSPYRKTIWEGPVLRATDWDEAKELMPEAPGIHCIAHRPPMMSFYDSQFAVRVRLRLSGSVILGTYEECSHPYVGQRLGLRGEIATVDRIEVAADLASVVDGLADRYQCLVRIGTYKTIVDDWSFHI